jgi:hypothetical protein
MQYNDVIGTAGVGTLLLAYFLNTFLFTAKKIKLFYIMNILGSALACYASILIQFMPFIILEAVWCIVSIMGLYKKQVAT